jgi:hypothetical protein
MDWHADYSMTIGGEAARGADPLQVINPGRSQHHRRAAGRRPLPEPADRAEVRRERQYGPVYPRAMGLNAIAMLQIDVEACRLDEAIEALGSMRALPAGCGLEAP